MSRALVRLKPLFFLLSYRVTVPLPSPAYPKPEIPHGIRYNLTLHNRHNKRVMGFDNAHAVKGKKR